MPYEILVHISAPTTKERDDLYRDEALAYRNFKPSGKLFLDERDGELASHIYRHPRHHALWEDKLQETQRNPPRTFGPDSFNMTEPNSSNQVSRQFGTQVILDTQQAIGVLDSQISSITNSFYDGTTLSLTECRPVKRPRTAEPILEPFSSERGGLPAPDSPSSFQSPYALNTSFSVFDPISSMLPESYGLSKSGDSNPVQRAAGVTTGVGFSPFPATPQGLGYEFGRACYTPEDNDAAALLLGLRTGGTPAESDISPIFPSSQNDSPTAGKSKAPFRDRLSVSALQGSSLSQQQTPNDVSRPLVPNSVDFSDGEIPSPNFHHAPTSSPCHRLPSEETRSMLKSADGRRATEMSHLLPSSCHSLGKDARDNRFSRTQLAKSTNRLYALGNYERLDTHEIEGHDIADEQTSSRRSSISVGQIGKNGDKASWTEIDRTSMRSPVDEDDLPSQTNGSQMSVCGDIIPETQKRQITQIPQPDKIALSPRLSKKPREDMTKEFNGKAEKLLNGSLSTPTSKIAIVPLPTTSPGRTLDKRAEQLFQEINHLPLEVFSPKAPVGLDGSVTFVTPIIASFFAKAELRKRWTRNATVSRPISRFEIGHWAIETKSWPPRLQLSFWKVLTNQIGLRQAGISTWCKRIPEPDQLGTVKPLDEHSEDIRILTLHPASLSNEILISIHHGSFKADQSPEYEAISYAWGSLKKTALISIMDGDTKVLSVTQSLDIALQHLCRKNKARKLWIDAICIDQSNLEERGLQVQRMGKIYKRAKSGGLVGARSGR
ncbi:HET-domain-containing protein [Venturia nashicola]|uniref:HET-domain-containing protein n=1 Tax=Venturia nashicola TaxID=86259 RepID=A0A4Z1NQ83_9PEZI|nr:HET-domain-containing protein [Venturia nashicola]TLD25742.1 HET-domain-containing protein [Venturia nashicola]